MPCCCPGMPMPDRTYPSPLPLPLAASAEEEVLVGATNPSSLTSSLSTDLTASVQFSGSCLARPATSVGKRRYEADALPNILPPPPPSPSPSEEEAGRYATAFVPCVPTLMPTNTSLLLLFMAVEIFCSRASSSLSSFALHSPSVDDVPMHRFKTPGLAVLLGGRVPARKSLDHLYTKPPQ